MYLILITIDLLVLIERQESDPISKHCEFGQKYSAVHQCLEMWWTHFPCLIYHIYIRLSLAIVPMTIASDNE